MQSLGFRGKRANYEAVSPIRKVNDGAAGAAAVEEKRARHAQQLRQVLPEEEVLLLHPMLPVEADLDGSCHQSGDGGWYRQRVILSTTALGSFRLFEQCTHIAAGTSGGPKAALETFVAHLSGLRQQLRDGSQLIVLQTYRELEGLTIGVYSDPSWILGVHDSDADALRAVIVGFAKMWTATLRLLAATQQTQQEHCDLPQLQSCLQQLSLLLASRGLFELEPVERLLLKLVPLQ